MADKLVPFTTRIPGPLRKRIKMRASRDEVKVEELVRRLFEAGFRSIDIPVVQPRQDVEASQ